MSSNNNYSNLISLYPNSFNLIEPIYCDLGWYNIIFTAAKFINASNPQTQFTQIKEKFGALRLYTNLDFNSNSDKFILGYLAALESISTLTCESCGNPGTIQQFDHLLKSQCPPCAHNRNKLIVFK